MSHSPPDSSHFDSSGNLSLASSQLSSEPEEHRDPSERRPSLNSQPTTWEEQEQQEEEFEKEPLHGPEPDSNRDVRDSSVIQPEPVLDTKPQPSIWYAICSHMIIVKNCVSSNYCKIYLGGGETLNNPGVSQGFK